MDTIVTAERPGSGDRAARVLRLANGRGIGYAEYGDPHGLPAIALHGTPGSRYMFALTDEGARARGLRLIAPERPGYGLSEFQRMDSLAETAADVEAIADALGLDRFALIGVSGGGPYAIAAAALLKSRVLRLALIGPVGPLAECGDHIRMTHLHRLIFTRMAPSHHAAGAFFASLRFLVDWAPGVAYHILMQRVTESDRIIMHRPEVRANLQAAISEGLRSTVEGALQDLRLYCGPWDVRLAEIDVPAIMWQGSDDTIVPADAAYHLAGALPNCRLEVVEGAGHYWVFGDFGRVLDAVRATWPNP
ncbi:MAG: alpha/beta fold hydrolase [Methyloceanibacter sp.]|uniref:alpha/beta fold hydrolase n=1 Tax=Methyloceanibacter sp. TaxID=1965321 RepID=UPI003D6C9C11